MHQQSAFIPPVVHLVPSFCDPVVCDISVFARGECQFTHTPHENHLNPITILAKPSALSLCVFETEQSALSRLIGIRGEVVDTARGLAERRGHRSLAGRCG